MKINKNLYILKLLNIYIKKITLYFYFFLSNFPRARKESYWPF